MENFFGLDDSIIAQALKENILIEVNGQYVEANGVVSLAWHPILRRFVLVFGNDASNASFVLLEDIDRTWKVKKHVQ